MRCLNHNWKLAPPLCKKSRDLNSSVSYLLLLVFIVLIWWSILMHACSVMSNYSSQLHGLQRPRLPVRGAFRARILEWLAVSHFRAYSRRKDRASISGTGRQTLYLCTTWEPGQISAALQTALSFLKTIRVHREATFPRTVDLQACDT